MIFENTKKNVAVSKFRFLYTFFLPFLGFGFYLLKKYFILVLFIVFNIIILKLALTDSGTKLAVLDYHISKIAVE